MMLVDNLIHSDLHPGNILVRLEPPSGLLGLAYKALTKLLDVTAAGGACHVTNRVSLGDAAGASPAAGGEVSRVGRGEADREVAEGVPACGSSGKGDGADCVSISNDKRRVVVPGVEEMIHRRQQKQQGEGQTEGRARRLLQDLVSAAAEKLDSSSSGSCSGSSSSSSSGQSRSNGKQRRLQVGLRGPLRDKLAALHASWLQPRIVLLDVGMATELTPKDQTNMVGLFKAFSQLEGREAADWVLKFSGEEQACRQPDEFR